MTTAINDKTIIVNNDNDTQNDAQSYAVRSCIFPNNWDKYSADLSEKLIVSKYIEKYYSIIENFIESYKISDDNLLVSFHKHGSSFTNCYFSYENRKYYNKKDGTTLCFYININNLWCIQSSPSGWIFKTQNMLIVHYINGVEVGQPKINQVY